VDSCARDWENGGALTGVTLSQKRLLAYRSGLLRIFGRPLSPRDATPEARLRRAEKRLGFSLPAALRDYLRLAGQAKENREHNWLLSPEALVVEDGYLVFMEENQSVVDWGIPRALARKADPTVWQRVNGDAPKWYSEKMCFSEFILANLAWQRGVEGFARE
jgi:hypothetical protein